MTSEEIARMQDYLRRTFDNERMFVDKPIKPGAPIEVRVGQEFIGVLYRDEDEGEISYTLNISILGEDLPPLQS